MTSHERIEKVLKKEKADYIPVWLSSHSKKGIEENSAELAEREIRFQDKFDWDMARIAPAAAAFVVDWGCEFEGGNHLGVPVCKKKAVNSIQEWKNIKTLAPEQGRYGTAARAIHIMGKYVKGEKPNLITVFSPLSIAQKLAPEGVLKETLIKEPDILEGVLERIAETNINFIRYCASLGGDGVYFPTQTANYSFVDDGQFERFEFKYDQKILNAIEDTVKLRILHLHGDDIRIKEADRFSVEILNWADRRTVPSISLQEGKKYFSGTIMGGINGRTTLTGNNRKLIQAELENAVRQMDGRPFILSPCCVIPVEGITEESLHVVRNFAGRA